MRARQTAAAGALLAALLALPYIYSQQTSGEARTASLLRDGVVSLRLEFGANDNEPRRWDGAVTAENGELLGVRNWHPRPGDAVTATGWKLAARRGPNFVHRAWDVEPVAGPRPYLNVPGVILDVRGSAATALTIDTAQGRFTLRPFDLVPGGRRPLLDGAVIAERVSSADRISPPESNSDAPAIVALPGGRLLTAWVAFADNRNSILTREFDGTGWGAISALPAPHTDIFQVKLAAAREGASIAVWSAQENGNWDLYTSRRNGSTWTAPERLTAEPQPDIYPATTADASGAIWVAWQGFRDGRSGIFARRWDGSAWSPEQPVSNSAANNWTPAIAADSKGRVHVAWDTYDKGNYDVMGRTWSAGAWSAVEAIAATPKWEANVSLSCDAQDRLWAAWNEAGMDWGKDTGFLPRKQGTPLYRDRWLGVAVHDGARWMEPAAPVNESLPPALRSHNDLPLLATHTGRVWLLFRHRTLRIRDTPSDTPAHRAAWEIHATSFDGGRWTPPVALPFSGGRQDMRMGVASTNQGLYAAWPMDNRDREAFLFERSDIYAARLALPPSSGASLQLAARATPTLPVFPTHLEEARDLETIQGYVLQHEGRNYRIYRGDTHRHTEFSHDGNNDGSLLDAYRYAIDAARLDFLLVSEHNGAGGPDIPYINWTLQQAADIFSVAGTFVPFFGYERSAGYPNGHRNVLLPVRGTPTLPIPPEEQKAVTGARMLYDYLKKNQGIAISHTSASSMGTDWRDNDPAVEPLVEIYQGDRVSAEYEGAPKAAHKGNPASAPGGFRPAGYVWNAWAKGYKLGVQAASDHLSTHISYACTIAADFTRNGLLDAMKRRHSYGATDNIVLDYRLRAGGKEYLQGDIVPANGPFELSVKVIGTQPIRQIDIIRSNEFVHARQPLTREVAFSFRDAQPRKGESYYYVRVIQVDDQMAWSSPIWIQRQ